MNTPTEDGAQFVAALGFDLTHPEGLEIRHIGQGPVLSIWPNSGGVPWAEVLRLNRAGRNMYIGVCARKNRDGTKDGTSFAPALWADIEGKTFDSADWRHGKELAMAHLRQKLPAELQPSMLVDSGHGWHCYWLLREPWEWADVAQRLEFEAFIRALAVYLRGDTSVADAARIMRLPGTFNVKQAAHPVACTLVKCEVSRRFNPSDFEDYFEVAPVEVQAPRDAAPNAGERPGDKWAAQASWADVIEPHGWQFHHEDGGEAYWTRPGKAREDGFSASTGYKGADVLHIWTDGAPPFDSNANYSKFAAYTMLNHGGDYRAAARALAMEGFGTPRQANVVEDADDVARAHVAATVIVETGAALTDMGNALRFVAQHGQDVRYCYAWQKWLIWDGRRWRLDDGAEVMRLAKQTVRNIYAEASGCDDDDRRKALWKHAGRSESHARLNAMIALAQSEPGIPAAIAEMDVDPYLFNCVNGTIDLTCGLMRPHERADLITKLSPVAFDERAPAALWEQFLYRVLGGSERLVRYLQTAVGYTLTGMATEECLFLLHGMGANGKTRFIEAVMYIMGEYGHKTKFETFLDKRNDGAASNDVARLRGARYVAASESPEGRRLAENLVKELTGGDTVTARFLFQEFFDFKPQYTLWLAANHKPTIRGTDDGIWRRVRLVPFNVTIPERERDSQLGAKLEMEAAGILRWAVDGCMLWQQHGLGVPEEVRQATDDYRLEQDVLGAFIAQCCVVGDGAYARASALYQAYSSWSAGNNERPVTGTAFGREMRSRGFEREHDRAGWRYVGIGITTPMDGQNV